MAEATLLGQNSGSSGSGGSVNLMDLYDSTKYDWYYTTLSDLTTPINQEIATVRNNKGYLMGVAFSDGNSSLAANTISFKVYIDNKKVIDTTCYGSNNGAYISGIVTTPFMLKTYGSTSSSGFFGLTTVNQNYNIPYTGATVSSTIQNQLLIAAAPIPFTSLEVDFTSTLSTYNSKYNFILLYVLKKS